MVSAKKQAFLDRKRKLNAEKEANGDSKEAEPYAPLEEPPTKKHKPFLIKTESNGTNTSLKQVKKPKMHEKPKIDADNKNSTLFIRNLSFKTTQEELEAFFSAVSPVKHTVIITNPETKVSLGYGFVSFATPEDASQARSQLAMERLGDRLIKIDFAEKRARKDDEKAQEKATRKEERVNAKKEAGAAELIVRNLSFKVRDPVQLRKVFEKYGGIKDVRIPRGAGAKMMGFAFVVFKKREHAEKAIAGINGTDLEGRIMAVDWSVKQDDEAVKKEEQEEAEIKEESDLEEEESDSDDESSEDEDSEEDFDEVKESENPSSSVIKKEESDDESEESDDESDSPEQRSSTLFIRNLLFETTEQEIYQFFRSFGPLRYARIVKDHFTGRSRGTAFVAFIHVKDAQACLELYQTLPKNQTHDATSLLLSEERKDGIISRFILAGRLLDVQESLSRDDAAKRVDKNDAAKRLEKGKGVDKRNLFLLNEGRIGSDHPLFDTMSETDKSLRTASYSQRKSILARNPGLHLSLTRLSIRNLPRHVGDRELKYLARQSIVGFGSDVKDGKRSPLTKEETARDVAGNKGTTGVVKQAKVVLEKDGSRSRGYGFISFASHRFALMALRWLNARQIGSNLDIVPMKNAKPLDSHTSDAAKDGKVVLEQDDRKRRLIAEFAIENISVVKRRAEKEQGSRVKASQQKQEDREKQEQRDKEAQMTPEEREQAKVGRIISKKRMMRKGRK